MAMISEISINKIFGILGDTVSPKFHDFLKMMPPALAASGIYPIKNCTSKEASNPTKTNCYAGFSFSPFAGRSIMTHYGSIYIEGGACLQGRLNFLGFKLAVKAKIKWIGFPCFYFDAISDPLNLGNGILQVGRSFDDMKTGPRFYADFGYSSPIAAAVVIRGAFKIDPILAHGYANITLSKEGFSMEAGGKVFGFEAKYKLAWTWTFKHFVVQGQYMVAGAGTILAGLCRGLIKLIIEIFRLGEKAMQAVLDAIPKVKEKFNMGVTFLKKKICGKMKSMARKICKTGVKLITGPTKLIMAGANLFRDKVMKKAGMAIMAIPRKMFEAMGFGFDKLFGPNSMAVKALDNIFRLSLFEWKLELDNGNLEASVTLKIVVFGKALEMKLKIKINIGAIVKKIWDATFGVLINFAKSVAKGASEVFSAAGKKIKQHFKQIGKQIVKGFKKFPLPLPKIPKISNPFRRRRRRRKWFRKSREYLKANTAAVARTQTESSAEREDMQAGNLEESKHSDDSELDFADGFGSDEYVDKVVEDVLSENYKSVLVKYRNLLGENHIEMSPIVKPLESEGDVTAPSDELLVADLSAESIDG